MAAKKRAKRTSRRSTKRSSRRSGNSQVGKIAQFKDLLTGQFFKFIVDEETPGPQGGKFAPTYVKTGTRTYVSPLVPPERERKYTKRVSATGKTPVRAVPTYKTAAFPYPV